MVIFDTHQKIDALKQMLPEGFVFVIDTTDRSFVYKSSTGSECEQRVILLDQLHGIDRLTQASNHYAHKDEKGLIKVKKIGHNTYIGFSAPFSRYSEKQWEPADSFLENLN